MSTQESFYIEVILDRAQSASTELETATVSWVTGVTIKFPAL